jgi:hypothetical protein
MSNSVTEDLQSEAAPEVAVQTGFQGRSLDYKLMNVSHNKIHCAQLPQALARLRCLKFLKVTAWLNY